MLILFRVLQGIGGAMIMPLGMAIIFQTAPPRERGAVMGMFGLPVLVAPMTGPILGGYLVDAVGWRPIFLLGMPVGIAAVLYGMAILRETPRKHDTRSTGPGSCWAASGSRRRWRRSRGPRPTAGSRRT